MELKEQLRTSMEALRRRLQTAPVEGYRLIGEALFSERKLDEVERRLSQLGEARLSAVTDLIQNMGIGVPHQVLEALGYDAKWNGLDSDKAIVSKRTLRT